MILCICNGVRSGDLDRYHLIGAQCGRCINERKATESKSITTISKRNLTKIKKSS